MMNAIFVILALNIQRSSARRIDAADTVLGLEARGEESADDVACYCKDVKSMAECGDNKYPNDMEKPNGPRYFHTGVPSENGPKSICCKLDYTGLFSWPGWDYSKQNQTTYCEKEVRIVPASSCCRLTDKFGSIGVRVGKVTSRQKTDAYDGFSFYKKSAPTFEMGDIIGGEDYSGQAVPASEVQGFVTNKIQAGRFTELQCGGRRGTMDSLFNDTATSCALREGPDAQCCCLGPTLLTAARCLTATGGEPPHVLIVQSPDGQQHYSGRYELQEETVNGMPVWRRAGLDHWIYSGKAGYWEIGSVNVNALAFYLKGHEGDISSKDKHHGYFPHTVVSWRYYEGAAEGLTPRDSPGFAITTTKVQPRVLPHKYTERKTSNGNKVGNLSPQPVPEEPGMQELIERVADPEMLNNPDTEANESEMLFDWTKRSSQWQRECTKKMDVPYEVTHRHSKQVYDGQDCRMVWRGKFSHRQCKSKYKTKRWNTYSQRYKSECSEYTYRRFCPAGQAKYEKKIDNGTCMNESEGLKSLGSLSFECPDGYKSGKQGTAKFNKRCHCASSCA